MGTDSIQVPIFYGDDPEEVEPWVSWIGDFAYEHGFSDFETRQFACRFIEGDALTWYHDEASRSVFRNWADLKLRLFIRFSKSVEDTKTVTLSFQDRMKQLTSLLDLWNEEDEAKKQREQETMASEDSNQIVSNEDGFLKNIDQIVEQTQRPSEEKTEREEILTVGGIDSVVGEFHKRSDQEQTISAPKAAEEDQTEELNMNTKKKKRKRWKASLEIQGSLEKNLSSEELFGFLNAERRYTHPQEGENQVETERVRYACQVFDNMRLRGKRVRKKKRWKKLAKQISKHYRKSEKSRKIDGIMDKNVVRRLDCLVLEYMAEKMKSVETGMYHHRILNRMNLLKKGQRRKKGLQHYKKVYRRMYAQLLWGYLTNREQLFRWRKFKFKQKHNRANKIIKERLSGNHIACIWNLKLDHVLCRKIFSRWCKRKRGRERVYLRREKLPHVPKRAFKIVEGSSSYAAGNPYELAKFSPFLYGQLSVAVVPDQNTTLSEQKLKIGVVLYGGQAPAKLVTSGLLGYMQEHGKGSALYGFKERLAGTKKNKLVELNAEHIQPYRNQGGFDMLCGRRDKTETLEQYKQAEETTKKLDLDILVVMGGDNINTNACLLAENFMIDARSTGKYCQFVLLMNRDASNSRARTLLPAKWISEMCVPAVLAAAQLKKTSTEVYRDPTQKTQKNMRKLLYWGEVVTVRKYYVAACQNFQGHEDSILALGVLLQLFYISDDGEINLYVGFVESCSSLEGAAYHLKISTEARITVPRCQLLKTVIMTISTLRRMVDTEMLQAQTKAILNIGVNSRLGQEEGSMNRKGSPDLNCTWQWQSSIEQQFLQHDLGDKVNFKGRSIDTIIAQSPSVNSPRCWEGEETSRKSDVDL